MLDVISSYIVQQVQHLAELHEGELIAADEVQQQQLLHRFRPQQQFAAQPATHWAPWPHFTLLILDTRFPSPQPPQGAPNDDKDEDAFEMQNDSWDFSDADKEDHPEIDAIGNPTSGTFHNPIPVETDFNSPHGNIHRESDTSAGVEALVGLWERFHNNPNSIWFGTDRPTTLKIPPVRVNLDPTRSLDNIRPRVTVEEIPTTPPPPTASATEHLHTSTPEQLCEYWWVGLPNFYHIDHAVKLITEHDLLKDFKPGNIPADLDYNPVYIWWARALDHWKQYPARRTHIVAPPDARLGRHTHKIFNANGRLSELPFETFQLD